AINGQPGIFSTRYAGEKASDQENLEKLLLELANVPTGRRTARFRCIIALARDGNLLGTFEGAVEGMIIDQPRGKNGFGYDPIFIPEDHNQSFAELSDETKNRISHRARAVEKLKQYLRSS